MADDERQLIEDAKKNREQTRELREHGDVEREPDADEPDEGEPWAKASSGDKDSVTQDD
jgi:hypothetical protein